MGEALIIRRGIGFDINNANIICLEAKGSGSQFTIPDNIDMKSIKFYIAFTSGSAGAQAYLYSNNGEFVYDLVDGENGTNGYNWNMSISGRTVSISSSTNNYRGLLVFY